jgi:Fe-S-cluster containining protein
MGCVLCEQCAAACCRYIALPIDKPRTARDYDDIRWYVMHQGVSVFVEDGDWYCQFQTRCRSLGADNRCTIYQARPEICREYEPGNCDYAGGTYGYDHYFTHPRQIEEFYLKKTGKRLPPIDSAGPRRRKKSARATLAAT